MKKVTGQKQATLRNEWLEKNRIAELTENVDREAESLLTMRWGTEIPEEIQGERRNAMAIILESQRLVNKYTMGGWVRDNSVEATMKVFSETNLFDWVSVQPLLGPCGVIAHKAFGQYDREELLAKTRKMKCILPCHYQDVRHQPGEHVKEEIARLAFEYRTEIEREVLTDLRDNAGMVINAEHRNLDEAASLIASHMNVGISRHGVKNCHPNWLVTSPTLVEGRHTKKWGISSEIVRTDLNIAGMTVYVDLLFPKDQFLIGSKGNRFEAGYFYCPYVAMTVTPTISDLGTSCPRRGILNRCGKKLISEREINGVKIKGGEAFYGRGKLGVPKGTPESVQT